MRHLKFLVTGILFGIIMTKSEAVSWFRIQEMFRFQSFHMYGIIGTAVVLGMILVFTIKKFQLKNIYGEPIVIQPKGSGFLRYLFGGTFFGFGWALTGACPGPMYTLIGHGYPLILVAILSAILGTYTYGAVREKLPH